MPATARSRANKGTTAPTAAFCVRHKKTCSPEVGAPFILKSGFSCKSVSRANFKSAANRQIIASSSQQGKPESTESTARTFKATLQCLQKLTPTFAVLENVDSLGDESQDGTSNLDTILEELKQLKYEVKVCC